MPAVRIAQGEYPDRFYSTTVGAASSTILPKWSRQIILN